MTLDDIIPYLPHFQALLNTAATLLLATGYYYIRNAKPDLHRNCMATALIISSLFMVSYLTYHARVGYMPFAGQPCLVWMHHKKAGPENENNRANQ